MSAVRRRSLQDRGHWFESSIAHYFISILFVLNLNGCYKHTFSVGLKSNLTLCLEALDLNQQPTFVTAIQFWNNKLGYDYFVVDPYSFYIDFWVQTQKVIFGRPELIGHVYEKSILIKRDLPLEILIKVCYHELGHAIGLEHVDNKKSIMYYLADETSASIPSKEDIETAKQILNNNLVK